MSQLDETVTKHRAKVDAMQLPPDLRARVVDQLEEIARLSTDIEARVHIDQMLRYIDWVVNLPWNIRSQDVLDIPKAKESLQKHHYGLQPVKDRIIEYLSVLKLNSDRWARESQANINAGSSGILVAEGKLTHAILARRAPILCLVGLVGTGKTTLAKSIAEALGRKYVRIPFGGMSDALDLRGQSRVRPDAEIGLVMKGLRNAGTKNPVMLLDEIDRVAEHARGDIMGVLVELLDPEQNSAFTDHYLDFPFDLSEVLFIATANNTTHIATAVMDRLEPILMPSYSDEEKTTIARRYVLPALMRESGLTDENLKIDEAVWPKLVRPLGYDSGIRSLERTLNSICRKISRMIVEGQGTSFTINEGNVKEFLES
jgi:ATP-dependent Lon protease